MKKAIMIVGMALLIGYVFVDDAQAARVGVRQARQQERICQGVRSGELTRGEVRRLEEEQAWIRHEKREMWADGRITPHERMRLEKIQDRADRDIYRLKHNGRTDF